MAENLDGFMSEERVVIVEDNEPEALRLAGLVRDLGGVLGTSIITSGNFAEIALAQMISEGNVAGIFLDEDLGGGSNVPTGREVLRALQTRFGKDNIPPVVSISAMADHPDHQRAYGELGVEHFSPKERIDAATIGQVLGMLGLAGE
jgi:CheY-like chemotaxis protein